MDETRRRNLRTFSRLEGECLSEEAGEGAGEASDSTAYGMGCLGMVGVGG